MSADTARAGRREWTGLAVISLACLLYAMDLTVLNLAIPSITADLRPSAAQMLWIVDIYGFMVAGLLITMGTLGDRIGRRRLLMFGAAAFGAASILAALANSAGMLIAARALLGMAGATLAPSTLSLIRNMFHDPQQRTTAIGVWIASFSAGGAIGPLLGGWVLSYYSWHAAFLLAVPVMAALLVLGPMFLPEFRDPDAGRMDLPSAALSVVAVLAIVYGMKHMAGHGPSPTAAAAIAAGLAVGAAFLWRQRRLADPLIDLSLFRRPGFGAALAINVTAFFAMFASFLYVAQYLQLVLGMSPLRAGFWTLPSALGFIAGSFIVPLLAQRLGVVRVMGGGLFLAALGFLWLALVGMGGLALLVLGSVIFALGLSPVAALTTDLVVSSAPPERTGAASALSETSSELGGALGIAVLGSIATAVYRAAMDGALPPGLAPAAAEAARGTIGGALASAAQLPAGDGHALTDAARAAYVRGMQVSAGISAAIMLAAGFMAMALLRRAGGNKG